MGRSSRIAAVLLGLAWTGLAAAQAPPTERFITVREEGKTPQRCKLVKSWHEANGVPVFQVQAVESGELMTIVGSAPTPATPGAPQPKAMTTRIFHWGSDNKSPTGAPLPPPTRTAASMAQSGTPLVNLPPARPSAPLSPRSVVQSAPVVTPTPKPPITSASSSSEPLVRTLPSATSPSSAPTIVTPKASTTASIPQVGTPVAGLPQERPTAPISQLPPAPSTSVIAPTQKPEATPRTTVSSQPLPSWTNSTSPAQSTNTQTATAATPPSTTVSPSNGTPTTEQRLVPSMGGAVISQSPCESCSSCDCCAQPSCVCGPTCPPRRSLLSRLFNKTPPCSCPCETVICEPVNGQPSAPVPQTTAKPDAKVMCEPAHPGDWRESWGKVEPWKSPYNSRETVVIQPTPAGAPDPLQAPGFYRDLAASSRPSSSKLPDEAQLAMPQSVEMNPEAHAGMPPSSPPSASPGRAVSLPANESNAFWEQPPKPAATQPQRKYNAFDRDPNSPPPNGGQAGMPAAAQGPMPSMGPMPMMMPPRPPMPPAMVDSGVPDALSNAFTLSGTRRPIPADFGGTPQEENGFGVADMEPHGGQGIPPRPYMSGMTPGSGYPRPPMPNMMPLPPNGPMVPAHPGLTTPPAGLMPGNAVSSMKTAGVPQLLATLKDSLYPSQREVAAERLSELDGRKYPQVVGQLMKAARDDPAASVRAACVHALADMHVHTQEVEALVQSLKKDRDARVRHEAEEAIAALGFAGSPRQDSAIQQTSHK